MKTSVYLAAAAIGVLSADAHAGTRSSDNYTITTESTDAGGVGRAQSTNYSVSGSAVGECGVVAPLAASATYTAKPGYVGTLFDLVGLSVASASSGNSLPEGGMLQLTATQLLDDGTLLATLSPASVTWTVVSGPLVSVSSAGVATAGTVYQNTSASVRATVSAMSGTGVLTVLNVNNDDYGSYAGDGIDDAWQVRYFGLNNPKAGPNADADGSGQSNLFKYLAGLNPLDPNSHFTLDVRAVAGQPTQKTLTFSPVYSGRTYTVQYASSLTSPNWTTLSGAAVSVANYTETVTDPNAGTSTRFYRVQVSLP